jgi:hypothetical protein
MHERLSMRALQPVSRRCLVPSCSAARQLIPLVEPIARATCLALPDGLRLFPACIAKVCKRDETRPHRATRKESVTHLKQQLQSVSPDPETSSRQIPIAPVLGVTVTRLNRFDDCAGTESGSWVGCR